jgi:hypothetical protein
MKTRVLYKFRLFLYSLPLLARFVTVVWVIFSFSHSHSCFGHTAANIEPGTVSSLLSLLFSKSSPVFCISSRLSAHARGLYRTYLTVASIVESPGTEDHRASITNSVQLKNQNGRLHYTSQRRISMWMDSNCSMTPCSGITRPGITLSIAYYLDVNRRFRLTGHPA